MGGCLEMDEVEGTAEKLLAFIQDNPGCHLRQVKRKMGISMGTVQYQLICRSRFQGPRTAVSDCGRRKGPRLRYSLFRPRGPSRSGIA